MEKRVGVIGIILENNQIAAQINDLLHLYSSIIIGRMGIPYSQKGIAVISIIVDGTTDEIGALTGRLGKIKGVNVKSAISKN